MYFQDESRFGLLSHIGSCITARGVKPVVKYQHKFKNTYLYGSYSPINGNSFVWEIDGVNCEVFESYLEAFSKYKEGEYKIVVIDNAGFHSTKNIKIPKNIYLLNIPPYSPELNPAEKVWQHLKSRFKNQHFQNIEQLKQWLYKKVNDMTKEQIKSITHYEAYLDNFYEAFNI